MIKENILNNIDTQRNISMLFSILCNSNENDHLYSTEVFSVTLYFMNKILLSTPETIQAKFLTFFENDTSSENFFSQCHNFISIHLDKLEKGILIEEYMGKKYTDEISSKSYFIDKNLEKQIVSMTSLLCCKTNYEMQEYMRNQSKNSKSYNMVKLMVDYARTFLTHLNFPIAFDTFQFTLYALLEFITGKNRKNQEILNQENFILIANKILDLDYHHDENSEEAKMQNAQIVADRISIAHSKLDTMKHSTMNQSAEDRMDISDMVIPLPSTNFMISIIKFKSVSILLEMISGLEPTDYIFYSFRRNLDPEIFRKGFAYQQYFVKYFHNNEYQTYLFHRNEMSVDKRTKSPLIIEIGFYLFFILMKMEKNLAIDMDEKYYSRIVKLIPEKTKLYTTVNKNLVFEAIDLLKDIGKISTACCKQKPDQINTHKIHSNVISDDRIKYFISFYSNNYSSVDILYEGELIPYMFPKLPYCKLRSGEEKDKFLNNVDITNAKTKVESLMNQSQQIITEIIVDYYLRNQIGR